jgi:hypothetical protein
MGLEIIASFLVLACVFAFLIISVERTSKKVIKKKSWSKRNEAKGNYAAWHLGADGDGGSSGGGGGDGGGC